MLGGPCRDLMAGGLWKYMDEIGYACYDKAQVSIHPMVFEFRWPVIYNGSPGAFNIRPS